MVFNSKGSNSPFLGKGFGDRLLGFAKGSAGFLDNGLVQAGLSALAPEVGAVVTAASKAGLLQKVKNL
jgi:hypothetical protein